MPSADCLPAVVHRASWVLPVVQPAIENGAVAVQAGRITAVGRSAELIRDNSDARLIDHSDSVLMPGLVNGHTHLELSHLAFLSQQPAPASFTGWIENMLAERAKAGFDDAALERILQAARTALREQEKDGVVALCDISNSGLDLSADFFGSFFSVKEYLGLRAEGVAPALRQLESEGDQPCTGHAPYSTHADLLQALKQRAVRAGSIFPIHVAETRAETEMISQGRGEFRDFLERRGFWDGSFQATAIDNSGSVRYLQQLGILDDKTLCVHCVDVTGAEIDLLQAAGSRVCLCPGSNRYLGVGKAPLPQYLAKGILPALGTDSLTSNPEISIWREMRLLAEDHPDVDPADILSIATLGGAESLGLGDSLGSLEPGKEAAILAVRLPGPIPDSGSLVDLLVHHGSGADLMPLTGRLQQ
jgi:cytosine/adenosine deaminase-related metal-dependent hydrolase